MTQHRNRESGILLPIFSLPSPYGIGCFSKEAYRFIDRLVQSGQKYWQILPLGPTSYGDSPYQSFSTFAGNPYFIDPETLIHEGLLTADECAACDFGSDPVYIDYARIYAERFTLLFKAFERFSDRMLDDYSLRSSFDDFRRAHEHWLDDYCMFMALKDANGGKSWKEWDVALRDREPAALLAAGEEYAAQIQFHRFLQFQFDKQWTQLHTYANDKGISIIGDIPIYVALDSSDTWASPQLFQFDETNTPTAVAGCPPDSFSATGQLWGNPLYNWDYHREQGYRWWIRRLEHCFRLYDVVRIDHFRGFDEYYCVPYGHETAQFGHWEKGPGIELFHAIRRELGNPAIIAEDLGFLTDSVRQLLKDSGYPGMKVIQFAFDPREESDYLPHTYDSNCVVYTGTHDNETTKGWYDTMDEGSRAFARDYMQKETLDPERLPWDFIALAMASVARLCIIPMQDYLQLDNRGRINTPSTLGQNWQWRMNDNAFDEALSARIRRMSALYGRCPRY